MGWQNVAWFVFVGWWLAAGWLAIALLLSITVVLWPVGAAMAWKTPEIAFGPFEN